MTVHFTAEITEIATSHELEELDENLAQVAESFQVGDLVEGCYAYDTSLEDEDLNSSKYVGIYYAEAPPSGIVVCVNGFTFQTDSDSEKYFVQINTKDSDGVGSHASHATVEEFTITSSANTMTPVVGDLQSSRISLEFGAFWPGDPLSGDSLPLTAPVLEDWDIRTLGFGMRRGGRGASESVLFTATVTSVELLPDPAYVFYAKADADSGGDGLSWSTAYSSLQDAIAGNSADTGGAVAVCGAGQWYHCTFNSNEATVGPSLACLDPDDVAGTVQLSHRILRDDGSEIYLAGSGDVTASYSNIQGSYEGSGNIDLDPLFADPNSYDFHLKSQAGRWDPAGESWVQDDGMSPCIDAGDPNAPIMYEPFPNGGIINMGAYGGTAEASKSYF